MKTIIYLVQVSACTGIFYLFYHLVLRRLTFFTINRWYLLSTLVLSFVIPLITLPQDTLLQSYTFNEASFSTITEVYVPPNPAPQIHIPDTPAHESFEWLTVVPFIYYMVAGMLVMYLLVSLWILYRKSRSQLIVRLGYVKVMKANTYIKNSSFLNYIFINDEELSSGEMKQVIAHELVHIEEFHTLDKIIARLAQIVLWFNPFIYAYSLAIESNHEYEVDHKVSGNSDKEAYVNLLLRLATSGSGFPGHQFSKFPLSRRIAMLFNKPSKNMKKLIYALILPLIALSCLIFSNRDLKAASIRSVTERSKSFAKEITETFFNNTKNGGNSQQEIPNKIEEQQEMSLIQMFPGALQDSADLSVPITFTPDGDGIEDVLSVSVSSRIKVKSFIIFREGRRTWEDGVLFETSDITHFWDGSEKNTRAPAGTYMWSLEGEDSSQKMFRRSGTVTLVRDESKVNLRDFAQNYIKEVLTRSTQPLLVVDGIQGKSFSQLDPAAVEILKVLNYPADLASYGPAGANGVVLVTTKVAGGSRFMYSLNSTNITTGSVQVSAGTLPLVEGVDFTVNYTTGSVKILNQSVLNSGQQINIKMTRGQISIKPLKGSLELVVPGTFSPNGDGKADVLAVTVKNGVKVYSFSIYDKAGRRIFITEDISKSWNGTYNDKLLPPDTYYWILQGVDNTQDEVVVNAFGVTKERRQNISRSGTVSLIR